MSQPNDPHRSTLKPPEPWPFDRQGNSLALTAQLAEINQKLDQLLATLTTPNSILILRHPDIDRIAAELKGVK